MSEFKRIYFEGDTEQPVPLDTFLMNGVPGKKMTAIVSYDELHTLLDMFRQAMFPFVGSHIDSEIKPDELIQLRVKAGDVRYLNKVMFGVKPL